MRFVLIQEADGPGGTPPSRARYDEMVREAMLAEQVGFSCYALSEQHFNPSLATVSAPECLLAYVAARTERIRLRIASVVLLRFNHPLRVAERAATLDLITGGRFDLGTARSNNPGTLHAFGIHPDETRSMWDESLTVIRGALAQAPFEHDGEVWQVPSVTVYPRPVQEPHPPIHVSATSIQTHRNAGLRGIGVMTGNSLTGGWEYMANAMLAYAQGQESADVGPGALTDCRGALAAVAHCAPSGAAAQDAARDVADNFVGLVAQWYDQLASSSDSYGEMAGLKEIVEQRHDLGALIARAPYLSIGTPEFFVERAERLAALGYDEFILRIDGMRHEDHIEAIRLIGREVIPAVAGLAASPVSVTADGSA
jgi:alkanesulfonate monooxygenase SsuD/methylene tetrahydromethanopterin reductase-like flavin-dependent oxidoreductase (luciferase family)